MPLVNITADMAQLRSVLERIADALDRLAPPPLPLPTEVRPVTLRNLSVIDEEELWQREQDDQKSQPVPPAPPPLEEELC